MKLAIALSLALLSSPAIATPAAQPTPPPQTHPVALSVQEMQVIALALRHAASECGAGNEAGCEIGMIEREIDAKFQAAAPPAAAPAAAAPTKGK